MRLLAHVAAFVICRMQDVVEMHSRAVIMLASVIKTEIALVMCNSQRRLTV